MMNCEQAMPNVEGIGAATAMRAVHCEIAGFGNNI
jgi:hypothetical protein